MLLNKTVDYEKSAARPPASSRVRCSASFVGWRGLSDFGLGDVVADATFWGRQAAGQRVAVGSVRELFGTDCAIIATAAEATAETRFW